ncbi:hypothetical protein [Fischerella sp. PCC 9605]|uniref:hypothetical protein n=1 Tax=Fischerella sp. PCC 9605 TaxID=1173024 RepID=UPI00047CE807|nr:hypothetical protein [Fischerella sp. PCC 9605]
MAIAHPKFLRGFQIKKYPVLLNNGMNEVDAPDAPDTAIIESCKFQNYPAIMQRQISYRSQDKKDKEDKGRRKKLCGM